MQRVFRWTIRCRAMAFFPAPLFRHIFSFCWSLVKKATYRIACGLLLIFCSLYVLSHFLPPSLSFPPMNTCDCCVPLVVLAKRTINSVVTCIRWFLFSKHQEPVATLPTPPPFHRSKLYIFIPYSGMHRHHAIPKVPTQTQKLGTRGVWRASLCPFCVCVVAGDDVTCSMLELLSSSIKWNEDQWRLGHHQKTSFEIHTLSRKEIIFVSGR
jgi:hypothetical protein